MIKGSKLQGMKTLENKCFAYQTTNKKDINKQFYLNIQCTKTIVNHE